MVWIESPKVKEIYPGVLIGKWYDGSEMVRQGAKTLIYLGDWHIQTEGAEKEIQISVSEGRTLVTDNLDLIISTVRTELEAGNKIGIFSNDGYAFVGCAAACILNSFGIKDPFWQVFTRYSPEPFYSGFEFDMASVYVSEHTPKEPETDRVQELLKEADDWGESGNKARECLKEYYLKGICRPIIERCTEVRYRNEEWEWDDRLEIWERFVSPQDRLRVCPWEDWLKEEVSNDSDFESLAKRCFREKKEAILAMDRITDLNLETDELILFGMARNIWSSGYSGYLKDPENIYRAAVWPHQLSDRYRVTMGALKRLRGHDDLLLQFITETKIKKHMLYSNAVKLIWSAAFEIQSRELRERLISIIRKGNEDMRGTAVNPDYDFLWHPDDWGYCYSLADALENTLDFPPEKLREIEKKLSESCGDFFYNICLEKDIFTRKAIKRW